MGGGGVNTATDGTYAGYFEDDIFVAGQCTGCLLAYVAVNAGGEALALGDLVAPAGLAEPLVGSGAAVLRVQRAETGQAHALRTVRVQLAGGEGVAELPERAPLLGIVVETPNPATGLAQVMVSLR